MEEKSTYVKENDASNTDTESKVGDKMFNLCICYLIYVLHEIYLLGNIKEKIANEVRGARVDEPGYGAV